jgi:hypothetical protein
MQVVSREDFGQRPEHGNRIRLRLSRAHGKASKRRHAPNLDLAD